MNNRNMMLKRNGAAVPGPQADPSSVTTDYNGEWATNGVGLLTRGNIGSRDIKDFGQEKDFLGESAKKEEKKPQPAKPVAKPATKTQPAAATAQQPKPSAQQAKPQAQPAQPAAAAPQRIRQAKTPDEMCQIYIRMFHDTLGVDLSASICYENMRRMCEPDIRDPLKTLYFLENTYRVSTVLYLAGNFPILLATSILAEKNRKNILKYVSTEVENGSKPFEELLDLRKKRWVRKYENMAVNDAMTVTPGATMLTPELAAECTAMLTGVSAKLRRFNNEMTGIVARFDDGARNDVIYIYSNWWYFLQGFENVPEMRSYVMAITDDTRRNLKI